MRIIAKKVLRAFWQRHPSVMQPLQAWYRKVKAEDWDTPAKVKARFPNAHILADNRVVFKVKGNYCRLITMIRYEHRVVYVRFVGTHAEYDAVNAKEV